MPGMADSFQPEPSAVPLDPSAIFPLTESLRPPRPYPGFLSAVGLCVVMLALVVLFARIALALGKLLSFKPPQAMLLGAVNSLATGLVLVWGIRSSEVG